MTVATSTASVAWRHRSLPTFGPTRLDAEHVVGALAEVVAQPALHRVRVRHLGLFAAPEHADLELLPGAADVLDHDLLQIRPVAAPRARRRPTSGLAKRTCTSVPPAKSMP